MHSRQAGLGNGSAALPDRSESDRKAIWSEVDKIEEESACSAIPGVVDLLTGLSRLGVDVALVTSSWPRRIEFVLDHLELTGIFKVSVNRNDVSRGSRTRIRI